MNLLAKKSLYIIPGKENFLSRIKLLKAMLLLEYELIFARIFLYVLYFSRKIQ